MRALYLLLILVSINISADAYFPSCFESSTFERYGKKLFITPDDLLNRPNWDLGDGEPPISIGNATEKVMSFLRDKYSVEDVIFAFVHLKSQVCLIDQKMQIVWFYVFAADTPISLVGISMTGRLIEAVE